jgi:hypothetical protein
MSEIKTPNWNKEEFMAYVLIYCMKADFVSQESEINFIKKKVGQDLFRKTLEEFSNDHDYEKAQKIQAAFAQLGCSKEDKQQIMHDIDALFAADGNKGMLEQNTYRGLDRLLEC